LNSEAIERSQEPLNGLLLFFEDFTALYRIMTQRGCEGTQRAKSRELKKSE
jgi:hypothetical protein